MHLLTEILGILYIVQKTKGMKYIFKLHNETHKGLLQATCEPEVRET